MKQGALHHLHLLKHCLSAHEKAASNIKYSEGSSSGMSDMSHFHRW